jgi:predicted permease
MREWLKASTELRSLPTLEQLRQDVRYALRGLRRAPGFTATVIITLGLGIGANAAMFNVVDRLMFRPLAYLRDPGSVNRLYLQWENRGVTVTGMSMPYARYLDLRNGTSSFSTMAGFSERDLAVGEGEASRERRVGAVSASYFGFFDARPVLGRFFVADEDVIPRGADVAVLSYAFWQSAFGGRNVLGERLQVGDVRVTIIGVAPKDFAGVNDANPPDVFIPITTFAGGSATNDAKTYYTRYNWGWMHVMARRKPGITAAEAQADASRALENSWRVAGVANPVNAPVEVAKPRVVASSLRPGAGPDPALEARTALWVSVVATIVLLIASANVANLILVRALRRQHETALRLALGVSRSRLLGQSLIEAVVLALGSGVVALLVAQSAGSGFRHLLIGSEAPSSRVFTDARTLAVTLVVTLIAGIVLGLVPAFLYRRGDLATALRRGVRGGHTDGMRLRSALLVMQATLSVVLLVGATLFVRSLDAVTQMRMGYDADRVLLVSRVIRGATFDDSTQYAVRQSLLATAQSLPSVEAAAWVSSAPFVSTSATAVFVPGIDSTGQFGDFTYQATTPDYFRAMGTRIVRGRGFSADDRRGAPPVLVVSESMSRLLWPGQEALGKCARVWRDTMPCATIVGIAEDMVQRDIAATKRYHFYIPIDQFTRTWGNGLVIRMRGNASRQAESVRSALQRVIPAPSYVTVRPLGDIVENAQRSWRLGATMFGAFGALALIVASVGLYGVIAYGVAQRMHELGVRIALGAQRPHIVRLVVGHGARIALAGTVLGVAIAVMASRWIQPLLFKQSATDPWVYAVVGATMIAVALLASTVPALRAARADPNSALRAD